jgi:hypothetical protein
MLRVGGVVEARSKETEILEGQCSIHCATRIFLFQYQKIVFTTRASRLTVFFFKLKKIFKSIVVAK